MMKKSTGSKKTQPKTKEVPNLKPSQTVETPLTVWVASDFRSLSPGQYAKLLAAISDCLGVPVASIACHPELQEIH